MGPTSKGRGGDGKGGKGNRGGKGRKGKGKGLSLPKVNFLVTSLGRGERGGNGREGRERGKRGKGREGGVCVIAVGGIDAPECSLVTLSLPKTHRFLDIQIVIYTGLKPMLGVTQGHRK